jgi:colicin import membrane protein
MRIGWFTTLSSGVLSLILHIVIGALLIISFDFTPKPKTQIRKDVNFVEAVVVDKKQVELELARIKKLEEDKHKKEKKRLDDLEKKAKNLENKRKEEEKKLADTKKKKAAEEKKRKQEQARVTKLEKQKKELEAKRKLEEKKIKAVEEKAEKLKAEDEARKKKIAEEKRKEAETARLKAEEEKKKKDAADKKRLENELAAELAAEEAAEQASKDQALINNIASRIKRSIESNFNKVGLAAGLQCVLHVRLVPGGEVIDVSIARSSGSDIFDSRAEKATWKASPLPVPDDEATFLRLGLREINLTFKPAN